MAPSRSKEQSLIPFPVDTLFSGELKDFDLVIFDNLLLHVYLNQKHLEAINVSLSSLNEAVGVLSSQDMTASLKRAHAELWPGMDLPAELADIKNRLANLEAAMVQKNA